MPLNRFSPAICFLALCVATTAATNAMTDDEAMAASESRAAAEAGAAAETPEKTAEKARFADTLEVLEAQSGRTATATTVSRDEVARQRAVVVYDALDKTPGLHLRSRLGATGAGLSRLTIRGNGASGPAGLAVFVDGRPDASVSFAHPTPSAHGVEAIEAIEVIHGPSPVLHGPGKTGVVNITTRRPGPGWGGSLQLSGGSHSTVESSLAAGYGWDRGYLRVSGSHRETDGHNPASDARVNAGSFRAGFSLTDSWELELGAGVTDDHFSVFGPFFVPGPFGNPGTTDIDLRQTVADVKLSGDLDGVDASFQIWHDDLKPESQVLRPGVRRGEVSESGLRIKTDLDAGAATSLTVGLDLLAAEARNTPGVPPGRPEQDESLTEIGPYVFAEHRLSDRTELRGGVRLVDHSDYGTEPVAEIGVIRHLATRPDAASTLRVRATRGYQSPTLQQLFGVFRGGPAGLANPDLEPEILNQYEIGFYCSQGGWGLDLVAFLQEGSDLIQVTAGRLQNSSEYSHPGFEGRFAWSGGRQLTLDLGATWLDLEDNVLSVPDTTIDLGLLYAPAALGSRDATLRLGARWADGFSDRITGQAPVTELDSYFVADLKLRMRAWESVFAFLEIENLTDESYQTVASIPMPGRSVYAGVTVDF